jgi:chromosome segregation ATPase
MSRSMAVLAFALVAVAVVFGLRTGVSAQAQAAPRADAARQEDVLPALLAEVRGLRASMEKMASAGPRVQLALGRLELQEQRVTTLVRRLQEVRANLAGLQRNYDQLQQRKAALDLALRDAPPGDPQAADLKGMQASLKGEFAHAAADVERVTAEEAEIAAELPVEQARWTDLNQRMEALEASLDGR